MVKTTTGEEHSVKYNIQGSPEVWVNEIIQYGLKVEKGGYVRRIPPHLIEDVFYKLPEKLVV